MKLRLEVDVAKHLATVLDELGHELPDLVRRVNAVPEKNLTLASNAAIGLLGEPGQVLVILLDGPCELGEVALQVLEDVVGDVGKPCGASHCQCGEVCEGR